MSAVPCLFCGDPNPFMSAVEGMCLQCGDRIQSAGMPYALASRVKYEQERQRLEGVLSMAVARLGGEVEGKPTHKGNLLQRIDQLVESERLLAVEVAQRNDQWAKRKVAEAEVERLKHQLAYTGDKHTGTADFSTLAPRQKSDV